MSRSRLISEVIAFLILIGIVVAIGVVIALMTGAITQHSAPKGSVLLIHNVKVYSITSSSTSSRTILIKVVASVSGNSPIKITNISISWDTGSVAVTSPATIQAPSPGTYLKPGSLVEIQAVLQTSSPPANYATVWVTIGYCDFSKICGSVTGTGTVTPYTT